LELPELAWWVPCAFVGLGVALGLFYWVRSIGEPDAIMQAWDLGAHVNIIRAFLDSGSFSSLDTSAYLTTADAAIRPASDVGFYPSAWHALCALTIQVTGAGTAVVINASLFVLSFMVFPLAMAALLGFIFKGDTRRMVLGGVASVSFVSFPWDLLAFGPIYPFESALSCMPSSAVLFMCVARADASSRERLRMMCPFLVSLVGLALLQTSLLFTLGVFVAFYCVDGVWRASGERGFDLRVRLLASLGLLLLIGIIWVVCNGLPFMGPIVENNWPRFASSVQELVNIFTQTYTLGFIFEISAQVLLGILVLVGLLRALRSSRFRWVACTYLFLCLICFVGATSEGTLKHLLAGFWYCDPMRLAAMASVAAIPLAVLGMDLVVEVVQTFVRSYGESHGKEPWDLAALVACVAVFLVINFMPSVNWPGLHNASEESTGTLHTTFGDYRSAVASATADGYPLTSEERDFLDEVKATVEPDALVVNDPTDGSSLAYGYDGLRTYYRMFRGFDEEATEQSRIIMGGLVDVASDEKVRQAVVDVDARYVLLLDSTGSDVSFINFLGEYDPTMFRGVNSITDETPGFEKVLERGNMRLYRITV
jgi:hypothetical protein